MAKSHAMSETIDSFANNIRRVLYKEYNKLRLINGVVYYEAEDSAGNTSQDMYSQNKQ